MIEFEGLTSESARAYSAEELTAGVNYCSDQIKDLRLRQIEAQIKGDLEKVTEAVPHAQLWMARLEILADAFKEKKLL